MVKQKAPPPAIKDDGLEGPADEVKSEKVAPEQIPEAVRITLAEASKGGPFDEVEKSDADEYWTAANINGRFYDLIIEKDGTLSSKELDEKRVALETIPAAVLVGLTNAAEGEKIVHVHKRTIARKLFYNAFVMIGGKEVQIVVTEDGTLTSKRVDEIGNRFLGPDRDD
jgi:hypothetical protein